MHISRTLLFFRLSEMLASSFHTYAPQEFFLACSRCHSIRTCMVYQSLASMSCSSANCLSSFFVDSLASNSTSSCFILGYICCKSFTALLLPVFFLKPIQLCRLISLFALCSEHNNCHCS